MVPYFCSAVQQPPAFPNHLPWARSCGIHAGQQGCSPPPLTTALHLALCLLWDGCVSAFPELLYFPAKLCRCDACRGLGAFQLDGENRNLMMLHKERAIPISWNRLQGSK